LNTKLKQLGGQILLEYFIETTLVSNPVGILETTLSE